MVVDPCGVLIIIWLAISITTAPSLCSGIEELKKVAIHLHLNDKFQRQSKVWFECDCDLTGFFNIM